MSGQLGRQPGVLTGGTPLGVLTSPVALTVIGFGVLAAVLYFVATGVVEDLTVEDGVVEYGTAVGYFIAAAIAGRLTWPWRKASIWFAGLGLTYFFVAGEEISWGQRIFGVDTPEPLAERNVQGELTLHNLDGLHGTSRAIGLAAFVALYLVLPLAVVALPWVRRLADRLHVPIPPLTTAVVAVVAILFMVVPRVVDELVFALDEIGELFFSGAAVLFVWHQWQRRGAGRVDSAGIDARN